MNLEPHLPSEAVIRAVADREGVDTRALTPPLYEAIDPDALDAVLRRAGVRVTFGYAGYEMTVDHERAVRLAVDRP